MRGIQHASKEIGMVQTDLVHFPQWLCLISARPTLLMS